MQDKMSEKANENKVSVQKSSHNFYRDAGDNNQGQDDLLPKEAECCDLATD